MKATKKKSDSKKPEASTAEKKRQIVLKMKEAETRADTAKHLSRLAKKRLKDARKAFKLAKKVAKHARKQFKELQKSLAAVSKNTKTKLKSKKTAKPVRQSSSLKGMNKTIKTLVRRKAGKSKMTASSPVSIDTAPQVPHDTSEVSTPVLSSPAFE